MAETNYPPDPYNGWRNIDPASNYPASRVMTDTSGSVQLIASGLGYRIYDVAASNTNRRPS